jgi:hypothetical protein
LARGNYCQQAQILLGHFVDLQGAIAIRKKAELEYFGADRQKL